MFIPPYHYNYPYYSNSNMPPNYPQNQYMPYQMPYPMSGALPPQYSCSTPGHPTCADMPTDANNLNSPKSNNGTENDKPEDQNEQDADNSNKSDSGSKQGQDNGTGMGEGWGNDNNTSQQNNTWDNNENKPNWDQKPAQNNTAPAANNVDWNQTAAVQPQNTVIAPVPLQSISIAANQGDPSGQPRSLYGPFGPYYSIEALVSPDMEAGAEEEPRYDVPQHWSNEWRITKQVQCGRGYFYVHNSTTPVYHDSVREPYARFQFNYRTRGKSPPVPNHQSPYPSLTSLQIKLKTHLSSISKSNPPATKKSSNFKPLISRRSSRCCYARKVLWAARSQNRRHRAQQRPAKRVKRQCRSSCRRRSMSSCMRRGFRRMGMQGKAVQAGTVLATLERGLVLGPGPVQRWWVGTRLLRILHQCNSRITAMPINKEVLAGRLRHLQLLLW